MKKYLFFGVLILSISVAYLFVAHSLMVRASSEKPPSEIEYMIILGAKLNGDVMSLSLYNRVNEALNYLNDNVKTKVVVSGGQGDGEWISEAKAMAEFLIENGIDQNRIILEEKSTNTYENLKFSKDILGDDIKEIVIVTNDFHLYRSMVIARRQGFHPFPLAAQTPFIVKGKLWTREYIAIIKTWIFDW